MAVNDKTKCLFPNIPATDGRSTSDFCQLPASGNHVHFEVGEDRKLEVPCCQYHGFMYSILWSSRQLAEFIEKGRINGTWT